jgi:lysyl-tRNA synthetase class I
MLNKTMTKAILNRESFKINKQYAVAVIDGYLIPFLPDCPKCGRNEYHVTGTGKYLVCACGAKYFNRGRV